MIRSAGILPSRDVHDGRLRRGVRAIIVVLSIAAVLAGVTGSAAANRLANRVNLPVTPGSQYLALGDSVTAGYEEPEVLPAPDYQDAASFLGYPEQLGAELHLHVRNAARSGETTSSFILAPTQSTQVPMHVHYRGSQLTYALSYLRSHRDVRLVSLMIGTNDYVVCGRTTRDACRSNAEQRSVRATITRNIQTILSAIRETARYRGQIAIVDYYSLNYASAAANAQATRLNDTENAATRPFHVVIAKGYRVFQIIAAQSGDGPCAAGLLTQLGAINTCGSHPSRAGQALLAQAVETAIQLP